LNSLSTISLKTSEPVIETKGLSAGYIVSGRKRIILEDISIELHAGKLISFMGPNGSGKSTLLRTLSGIQKPLKGTILINQKEISKITSHEIAKSISVVLTKNIVPGNLSVSDLVYLGRYPYVSWRINFSKNDHNKVAWAIEKSGIADLLNYKAFELSDGQFQKVMIARALAQDGKIMILDEPNAHLDLNNRVEIMNLLRDLAHSTGKAVLLATHELDLALQTSDYLWLLSKDGQLSEGIPEDMVLSGAIDEVFEFKGYDLKTGKILSNPSRQKINLTGDGHSFLWTKNSLERNGYSIGTGADISIKVLYQDNKLIWKIEFNGQEHSVHSIEAMLSLLDSQT